MRDPDPHWAIQMDPHKTNCGSEMPDFFLEPVTRKAFQNYFGVSDNYFAVLFPCSDREIKIPRKEVTFFSTLPLTAPPTLTITTTTHNSFVVLSERDQPCHPVSSVQTPRGGRGGIHQNPSFLIPPHTHTTQLTRQKNWCITAEVRKHGLSILHFDEE